MADPALVSSRPVRFYPLGTGRIVTSAFGSTTGRSAPHGGVDFGRAGGSAGMPVYAIQSGTVIYAGAASGYGGPDPAGWLVIDSDDAEGGGCLEYGHIVREVNRGDHVTAGQRIGHINPNNRTNGGVAPHLHVTDWPHAYGQGSRQNVMARLSGAREPEAQAAPTPTEQGTVVGDPVWLADVVRPTVAKFAEYPGWRNRGHGDFKDIRGVMVHHTGGPASAASIANGRPDLAGPLAQLHISRDGTVTVVAVGVAWHAGAGSYPWLPTNMGNWHLIGIECEWPYGEPGINERNAYTVRWRDPEIIALRNTCAAILLRLGLGVDRLIGHKDYAGRAQGKWDPGNMSMDWLRGEVRKDMDGFVFPGEDIVNVTPPPVPAPVPAPPATANVLLHRGMSGPNVVKLQTTLRRWYSKLAVDGDFGPHTEACVRDRQRIYGLDVDGIVGPLTAAKIGLVL
ncbi:lysin A [Mycobacterium phage Evanesce]|uniref:Lysin A n=9 Tax=Gilesvirus giles TaxID=1982151 RepID=A0A514A683_9CAUD|nr:lysin A [Mycobacterium phage HH92]AKQ07808.1 lysin A [Mycobacterium phage Kinbote]ALA06676.1 lysin A [Mycobacterium phage OBUpride]ALF00252.1 lysin A [Mycobacterium phage Evanesce]QDH48772.1 lysin A [Mycobacterium phage DeepSoil15]